MRKFLNLLMILGILSSTYAQKPEVKKVPQKILSVSADCKSAIKIPFTKIGTYGPTLAPNGHGQVNEIKSLKNNDPLSFEKEHNSAWYYFFTTNDGELVIEITPEKASDDYDFMLFKYTDSTFFDQITKLKPVRTNISRSGKEGDSRTGLSSKGKSEYIHAGPGETFSKSLPVKKGEKYYLVLDNVYANGSGHTIRLGYEKIFEISGLVLSEDQKPILAEVIIEDARGNMVSKIEADSAGKYSIAVKLWESSPYTISFIEDSSFVESKNFNTATLVKTGYKITDIKTILPKLRGGKKYTLGGINFYPGSERLLPESYPSVNALLKLMKKNKKMVIRIEGHVNGPSDRKDLSVDIHQIISDIRAEAIYEFLISKGIEPGRISRIGLSNKFMLFPDPKNDEEASKNRRVEINVISIK